MVLLLAHFGLSDFFAIEVSAQGLQWSIGCEVCGNPISPNDGEAVGFYLESIIFQSISSQSSCDVVNI